MSKPPIWLMYIFGCVAIVTLGRLKREKELQQQRHRIYGYKTKKIQNNNTNKNNNEKLQ
jgi:hypothetical protein